MVGKPRVKYPFKPEEHSLSFSHIFVVVLVVVIFLFFVVVFLSV